MNSLCFLTGLQMKQLLFLTSLLLFLSGCRVGPHYHPPCTDAPDEWKHETSQKPLPDDICFWWEIFHDPLLNSLEQQAIENNPDLFVALERVLEAWAVAGISRADLFPQLTLAPNYSDMGTLFKLSLPGNDPTLPPIIKDPFRVVLQQYNLPLNMIYELDIWGKYQSRYESAFRNTQAKIEAYHTSLLTLTSNLASSYFTLRFLDTTSNILKETIATRKKNYDLAKNRFDKGLINYSDVASAALELSNTEASYFDSLRQRGIQENIIATLLGTPAPSFCLEYMPLSDLPPEIPAGIPASILKQRPDIAQAERNMASRHALIGAAYASFFPSIELTGTLGFSSPDFKQFLTWKSRLWAMGVNIAQTVFDGGRKCSELEEAWARFEQANGEYQHSVLAAFEEVENALTNLEYQQYQLDSLSRSVNDATTLTRLSNTRYQKGLISYIEVVTNERSELTAKQNYVNILSQRYLSTIELIKALGGSWDCDRGTPSP